MNSKKKIDALDIKIIKELLKNSRKSFSEIAEENEVSTATINNRFNELRKAGIIKGSSVVVDLAHSGVECDCVFFINVDPDRIAEFLEDTKKMSGTFLLRSHKLNAKYNVRFWSPIKNLREMEKLKESLKQHSAVEEVTARIWTYMKVKPYNLSIKPSDGGNCIG